jgi:DNA topoisomerase-1
MTQNEESSGLASGIRNGAMPRLRRSDASEPGIRRRRSGKGFVYLSPSGKRVTDPETRQRVVDLVIPPAWNDVWICLDPNGHLQAVGIDSAGRKQYLYHPRWRERQDQAKFDRMIEFGRALPSLRKVVRQHLAQDNLGRNEVLACAVRLLDLGFFRIGSEDYAEEYGTFGLATMLKRQVKLDGETITFDYISKGGEHRIQSVVDPDVRRVVGALKRRRGGSPELLAYKQDGRWRDVKSDEINSYIKEITGGEFTAKDFRTWNATVLCAMALALTDDGVTSKASRKRVVSAAVREVAEFLGNTPAVCRRAYIDPRVFDRFSTGATIRGAIGQIERIDPQGMPAVQGRIERAVLRLLEDQSPN